MGTSVSKRFTIKCTCIRGNRWEEGRWGKGDEGNTEFSIYFRNCHCNPICNICNFAITFLRAAIRYGNAISREGPYLADSSNSALRDSKVHKSQGPIKCDKIWGIEWAGRGRGNSNEIATGHAMMTKKRSKNGKGVEPSDRYLPCQKN